MSNGLSRRIEGIAQQRDPFEFNVANVKADDDLMNINSIEVRNSYTAMEEEAVDSAMNATHKDMVTLPARNDN